LNRDCCESLQEPLALFGRSAAWASNGQKPLVYLLSQPWPKLILLDWQMAGMDGATFLRELLQDPTLADLPAEIESGYPAARRTILLALQCDILEKLFGILPLLALLARMPRWISLGCGVGRYWSES
jgi:CheY-like chemotaxis protein